jgi:putative ABC transport system ATP-binding protein
MIELHELSKIFVLGDQTVHALDRVSLTINNGDYVSIMGPSGSGKSTLLNMLGLLDRPDSGEYLLDGIKTSQLPEEERALLRRNYIGFVFQSFHLIPRLNAQENIELPMVLAGIDVKQRRKKSRAVMERLGLLPRADHLATQLSGGQRQRVAIGRALVMEPKLLLADEPTGNLDSQSGADVIKLLEELNKAGITLAVVTHDAQIGARATRQVRMVDGRIVDDARV